MIMEIQLVWLAIILVSHAVEVVIINVYPVIHLPIELFQDLFVTVLIDTMIMVVKYALFAIINALLVMLRLLIALHVAIIGLLFLLAPACKDFTMTE